MCHIVRKGKSGRDPIMIILFLCVVAVSAEKLKFLDMLQFGQV